MRDTGTLGNRFASLLFLLALVGTVDAQQLPPPHALGGHCQLLTPCAESGPFAAHVRGLLELREADGARVLQWGGHLGLSFSFFDWGEGGVSLYGLYGAGGLAQGPVTLWGRVSPPFLRWTGIDDTVALRLAVQVEYAAAFSPFDGQGTLFPQTHTYLAVADAMAWRIRASLSAGAQLAEGAGPGYRGLQAGAGVWLRVDGAGLQFGAEVLGRAGTQAGTWRSEWTTALSVRMFDEGHQVKGGFSLPSSGGASILVGYGFSCGPSYAAATCFRGWGRSLFERTQDRLGAAILASWRARQAAEALAERYAAAQRPAAGSSSGFRMDWLPARALDPPPQADCPPYDVQLRIYPCRVKVAGWRSAADLVKGAITGTVESLPGANLAPRVPPGTKWFEVGRGAAAVATGVVETAAGAAGTASGTGVSGTGVGALVGVPVAAGSVVVGASGIKAVGDGVKRLVDAPRKEDAEGRAPATGAAPQGPPPAPATQVQSGATRGGAGPVRQGQAGVAKAKAMIEAEGLKVKGDEVSFKVPGGRRRPDFVAEDPNTGKVIAVEVKTGKSPYHAKQQAGDQHNATVGGEPVGKNAKAAGLGPGRVKLPTRVIRLP